jgi:hypothetical protein
MNGTLPFARRGSSLFPHGGSLADPVARQPCSEFVFQPGPGRRCRGHVRRLQIVDGVALGTANQPFRNADSVSLAIRLASCDMSHRSTSSGTFQFYAECLPFSLFGLSFPGVQPRKWPMRGAIT